MTKVIPLLLLIGLYSCSTIHFQNGPEPESVTGKKALEDWSNFEAWHHVGVLSLVEFSDPVALDQKCPDGKWTRVTVKRDVPQVIIAWIPYVNSVYSPWQVRVQCSK